MGLMGLLSACAVYKSDPIDLHADAAAWQQSSRVAGSRAVTQTQARQIGLLLNPDLNKARLKLANSKNTARQAGWWNDPSFSWDIEKVLQENRLNMSGGLAFTIPVTGLPGLEKQVAEQYQEADFWSLRQTELEFLSTLDQAWSKLAVTQRRKALIQERLNALKQENGQIDRLVHAGEAEFASRQLAAQRMNDAVRELQAAAETELEQTMALLKILGLHPSAAQTLNFSTGQGFDIPSSIAAPTASNLAAAPKIKAQMAVYATTETLLKTEIRKQYPELELGPSFTRDDGEKEVGGEIGFNVPLWNRNRKAIAESRGARDSARLETVQLWRSELFQARELAATQQMMLNHCRAERERMNAFASSLQTMEKLHGIGEAPLPELAENRHQLYESRLAFLDSLEKLLNIQAQLRHLTQANL